MPTQSSKRYAFLAIAAIVIIIAGAGYFISKNSAQSSWKTYTQKTFGLQISYPSDWDINDNMTLTSCCLFVVKYDISTTTATNASGTPVTNVTAKERVKLQIGPYDTHYYDPLKAASTTKVLMGANELYTGVSNGITFYVLPLTETNGIGIALFAYPETPPAAIDLAKQVISSIKLVPPTATATSTASATTTQK